MRQGKASGTHSVSHGQQPRAGSSYPAFSLASMKVTRASWRADHQIPGRTRLHRPRSRFPASPGPEPGCPRGGT